MKPMGWWRRLWGGSTEEPRQPEPARAPERRSSKDLLAEHTGQPHPQVMRDLEHGRDFDARAAVEYGLIDEVVSTPPKQVPPPGGLTVLHDTRQASDGPLLPRVVPGMLGSSPLLFWLGRRLFGA